MNLPGKLLKSIDEFLEYVPPKTVRRGQRYFDSGAVLELKCVEPDYLYAAIVRGGEDYDVGLEFTDDGWATECSCFVDGDCKHIVAALLALRAGATNSGKVIQLGQDGTGAGPLLRVVRQQQRVPRPPRSALCLKLTSHLGRDLLKDEAQFVRQIQSLFAACSHGLMESDLALVSRRNSQGYWSPVEIWPKFPKDDYELWLFVAHELRRRGWKYPSFMDGITDFSLIEPALKEWEREKEIAQWNKWFRDFDNRAPASDPGVLELRLAILPGEARLQWRVDGKAEFAEFKQAHAQKFAEQFSSGALALAPESLPLWSATYKPWHYESWWSFKYTNDSARPALNRLLRMTLAPGCIVNADGNPLPRADESLRLNLRAPENGSDAYELALATADGSRPPEIYCVLRGRPTLYLSGQGLFTGPSAELPGADTRKIIPAHALETADGLRFLHAADVPLPEHLARRIKMAPVTVTLSCRLEMPYSGSPTEYLIVSVTASAPGMTTEHFAPEGWREPYENFPAKASKTAGDGADNSVFVHDRAAQRHFPRVLDGLPELKYGGQFSGWSLRLAKKTPEAFVSWLKSLPAEIEVLLDPELATLRDNPVSGSVSLDVSEAGIDWFDLKVMLNVSDATLTQEELKLLLNARGGYVRLGNKGWRRLQFNLTPEDDEQLAKLGLDARDFSAEPQRFHALQLADDAAKKFLEPERVEKIQRRVSELKTRVSPPLPSVIRAEMRSYQTDGFHFLAYLTANRFGGVLADDMGLGKTLQTLAWLAWLREGAPGSGACSLVVCPKSVMDNWRAEAERFYPGLRVQLWRGEGEDEFSAAREKFDVIVVNYAQLRALSPGVARVSWLAVVLDEAQYIKNPDSQTAQAARALRTEHRLALTGTPIENRLLDLWSIFSFAMPGALGNRAHFLRRFNDKQDSLARRRLAARVRPFLLRRTKSQVAKDLPDRVEEDLFCEMEGKQKTLYRAELKRAQALLLKLKTSQQLNKERFNILTSLLRLRQICCHPALVNGELREAESAKLSALEDLLEPLMEEGHKVLVFSQFVTMLDLLREKITERQWRHFYLAGETENRGELVKEFQSAKGGAVFLISLKAGGFGLNLTAASYVVLFDPWWNPAVENQAIDRTHRIGQTSKVMAYRLLIRESIEEKIRALQKQKASLAGDVLGEERFAQSLTLDDLRFLFAE